nr:hAT dimerization domain, ribonuclease H-like domain protein [Tanacetum cinerariifolium]
MASQETQQETQGSSSTDTYQPLLWEYVTKLEKQGAAGGAWKFKCNLCSETRQGSYSKVRAHFLGIKGSGIAICKSVTAGDKQKMKQLEEAHEEKKSESNMKEVTLPFEAGVGFKKRKGSSTPIERAFGVEIRDQLDQQIARMSTWKEKGVTIVSDGWSDPTRKPLINFMATSGNGPLFLKAMNYFGEVKDRFFIADLMKEVINEIGHQNVVQIITDNATNYKAAGQLIESQFPHIYWTPCVVHKLEDDTVKANFVKEKIVNDEWWDKVSYILSFTIPIYEMIRACDTNKPCLHLVYEMWDSMIEKVKIEIYKKEKRPMSQLSLFYDVVHGILVARWAKNNTPLHCLAHSLNPRYYSDAWLLDDSTRSAPYRDAEISQERMKCFRRLFPNDDEHSIVLDERNKLTTSRAQDLVYIHNNLQLLSRNPNDDVKMWDVGGDAFDSMEDVGFLVFANISLDETEFENDLIIDN